MSESEIEMIKLAAEMGRQAAYADFAKLAGGPLGATPPRSNTAGAMPAPRPTGVAGKLTPPFAAVGAGLGKQPPMMQGAMPLPASASMGSPKPLAGNVAKFPPAQAR